jgi:site-specific DNA recombinase
VGYRYAVILTADALAGKLAREYLRVSQDKAGKLESPAEQHGKNAEAAAQLGILLGDPYAEPEAVSAARWSSKARAEFERLVSDLNGGTFGAHILVLWQSNRGGRSVSDWVRLIDACEKAGAWILVTAHGRVYDPANPHDRMTLQKDAVDAEHDNATRRADVLRTTEARAARGEAHGRVPFGYRRAYDPITRRLVAQEAHPDEAPVVGELFRRLRARESAHSIERDFRERGVTTRGTPKWPARPFSRTALVQMALNPAYAGLRTRQPKGAPRRKGLLDGAVEAVWPPIVDPGVYHEVRAMLTAPARATSRDGRARHLLGMIATCGVCLGPLTVRYGGGRRLYVCQRAAHVKCEADDLDAVAVGGVVAFLSRPEVIAGLRQAQDSVPELEAVRAGLVKARAELEDWRRRACLREVSAGSFAAIEPAIAAAVAGLEQRERELAVPPELAGWTGPEAEVTAKWGAAPLEARRRVARTVLSPRYLGTLRLERAGRGQHVPAALRAWCDRGGPAQ